MKKRDNASLLTTGVTILLCIFFVGGFIIGLNRVMDMEGTFPPVVNEEGLTAAPQSGAQALDFLNKVLDKAMKRNPKTEIGSSFSIDDDTIKTDGSDQFLTCINYVTGNVESYLEDSVEKPSTEYYESVEKILRLPNVTKDQITGFECNYIYYQCSSCGKTSDTPLENCVDCGNEKPYDLKYNDKYKISLCLAINEDVLNACFAPRSQEEYTALVNTALEGKAKLDNISIEYTELTIYFEVDRLTDKITYLSYRKGLNVSFDAQNAFTGDWSNIKGGNVSFLLHENYDYSFTWPALTLSDHYMTVEPGGNDNLLATLTCDDPLKYTVTWTSSDESLVKVDDQGYFDAEKATGKAYITATYEFGGVKYEDTCEIDVKVPVERLSMSEKKINLAAGESKKLSVKFHPSDATYQTVTWYTEDENIATVDKDGTVHAVSSGKVTVYCLSDDDYFKSTCEVTVE